MQDDDKEFWLKVGERVDELHRKGELSLKEWQDARREVLEALKPCTNARLVGVGTMPRPTSEEE